MSSPINVSYVSPEAIIAVAALFPSLSIVFVGLRFYVRRVQRMKLLADDWLLIPALALIIGMGIALIIGAKGKGVGYTKGLPPGAPLKAQFTYLSSEIILTEKVQFIFQPMQIISLGCTKLSFVMFYRRIFCTGMRTWFSISVMVMGALIIGWTIAFFFVFIFYCGSHPSKEWSTVVDIIEYCPNALNDQMAIGISDAVMDAFIIAMPLPAILNLHLSTTKKIMIMVIFLLGGFAVAASIVRMAIFIQVATVGFNPNLDGDKDISLILFWSMIETGTAIIAACLPTMKVFFSQSTFEKILSSIKSTVFLRSRSSRSRPYLSSNIENQPSEGSLMEHNPRMEGTPSVESYAVRGHYPFQPSKPGDTGIRVQNTFRLEEVKS